MHSSEIDHEVKLQHVDADLRDSAYGDRPVLLGYLAEADGTDILVPTRESADPEASFVALTHEQAAQALLVLASQFGKEKAIDLIMKQGG